MLDLSELLGCKVDVVTDRGLRPRIRDRVLLEAVPLEGRSVLGSPQREQNGGSVTLITRSGEMERVLLADLAKAWRFDDGGKTLTLELRRGETPIKVSLKLRRLV